MPDLEERIGAWRRQMLAAGITSPVPLDELEGHLREGVEQEMRLGLSVQDAFEKVRQRIGQPDALEQEFAKIGVVERKYMKQTVSVVAALSGMAFGLSMVLPQLAQWSRTGVIHSLLFLLLGVSMVIAGGSAALYGIKTHREVRGRKWIGAAIIATCCFYVLPFVVAFFQSRETNLSGWIFCAGLATASILFFGGCFYLNRRPPASAVHGR